MKEDFFILNSFSKFLEISGEDTAEFLQGLISNDIYKCKSDTPIYSCMLSPQGKFLADFFIIQESDKYLIEIDEKYLESFISKIQIYKLRSKVDIIENKNICSIILFSKENIHLNNIIKSFEDPRNKNIGNKIYIDKNEFKKIKNMKTEPYETYKEILMKNLIPNSTDDLTVDKSLLLENNFDNLNAIDWDKGCYVGQEITARMKYRALLKKQLYSLKIVKGEININDDIYLDEINYGKVISKVNQYILCMLKIELVEKTLNNKENFEINNSIILKIL